MQAVMHQKAIRSDAGLARIAKLGVHGAFDGSIDVSVFENDEGSVAAEFQAQAFDGSRNLDRFDLFERGNFLNRNNIINILRVSAPLITLAGAFTLLMVSGHIDLSIGSAMSLCGVVYAMLAIHGVPFPLAVALGMGLGAINGLLVVRLRITPIIATLITLSLYKGIALLLVEDGVSAIKSGDGLSMPGWFNAYGREAVLFGLPMAFWVAVLVTVVLIVAQNRTLLGKYAAATGGNPTAAKLSGVRTGKLVFLLYVIVGGTAALAGIARSSFMSLGDPLSGDGMELAVILVVLLGGTAFSGGEGRIMRSFVATLIIMALTPRPHATTWHLFALAPLCGLPYFGTK